MPKSVLKRNKYRQNYLRNPLAESKAIFRKERRSCKQVIEREREKRKYIYERDTI